MKSLPVIALLLIGFWSCSEKGAIEEDSGLSELIVCGDEQVIIIDRQKSTMDSIVKVWEWNAATSEGLPEEFHKFFQTTDDCKPVGENQLLITSSGGGVALVDRESKKTIFYAHVPNAHSATYLPGDRIVVALSTAQNGNAIRLYDIHQPDKILYTKGEISWWTHHIYFQNPADTWQ